MEIKKITTTNEFDSLTEAWRKLAVWQFGPLSMLDEEASNAVVTVVMVDDEAVAYLIAEANALWHIETKAGHTGKGYARKLAEHADITFAWEVCSDEGAAFCEALDIEFDDARE